MLCKVELCDPISGSQCTKNISEARKARPIMARPTNGAGDEPQSVTARVKTVSSSGITLSRRLVPALTATPTTMVPSL